MTFCALNIRRYIVMWCFGTVLHTETYSVVCTAYIFPTHCIVWFRFSVHWHDHSSGISWSFGAVSASNYWSRSSRITSIIGRSSPLPAVLYSCMVLYVDVVISLVSVARNIIERVLWRLWEMGCNPNQFLVLQYHPVICICDCSIGWCISRKRPKDRWVSWEVILTPRW